MLRSGDPGKDRRDQRISKAVELDNDISREEVLREEQAQKFFDEMQKLRKNLNELKSAGSGDEESSAEPKAETSADTDADTAAAAAASEMSEAPAETEETESAAVVAEALAQSFAAADQMTAAETEPRKGRLPMFRQQRRQRRKSARRLRPRKRLSPTSSAGRWRHNFRT